MSGGKAIRDVIALAGETLPAVAPLLSKVMENGRRCGGPEPLDHCRARCRNEVDALPDHLMSLSRTDPGYPVELSPGLTRLRAEMRL
jgi:hypothetical protein